MNKFDEKDQVISYFNKLGLKSTNINLHSSIIYQFPSEARKYKSYISYEFPIIEEPYFQQRSISKYEIPQYIPDIPEGFSVFCTLWEASKVKQYMLMSQEEQEKLNIKENYDKQEKENHFEEPIPKSNYCYICHIKFEDYLLHLETKTHKLNLKEENTYFNKEIKNVFKRINKFWNNNIYDEDSSESNIESSEYIKSNLDENKNTNNNTSIKIPILSSSVISLINDDIKKEENIEDNKENISMNKNEIIFGKFKYNYGNNYNFKDNNNINNFNKKKKFSHFKLLKKKRITFDVIRYEDANNKNLEFKREFFSYLNKYKMRKFIGNFSVIFK